MPVPADAAGAADVALVESDAIDHIQSVIADADSIESISRLTAQLLAASRDEKAAPAEDDNATPLSAEDSRLSVLARETLVHAEAGTSSRTSATTTRRSVACWRRAASERSGASMPSA